MERKKVYQCIDKERDYQDKLVSKEFRSGESDRSVPAELVMMQVYLNHALHEWTDYYGDEKALHQTRKLVAIGIRCLENHGCPERKETL